jgi:hypothetical protein
LVSLSIKLGLIICPLKEVSRKYVLDIGQLKNRSQYHHMRDESEIKTLDMGERGREMRGESLGPGEEGVWRRNRIQRKNVRYQRIIAVPQKR